MQRQSPKQEDKLVFTIDKQSRITYVNDALCEGCGISRDELLQATLEKLTHGDMPKMLLTEMWDWLKQGYSWHGVFKGRCKDGSVFWTDLFITAQYEQGEIVGYQCVGELAKPDYIQRAEKLYSQLNRGDRHVLKEVTRTHKFLFLTLLTIVSQAVIFFKVGFLASCIAAFAAMAPILVFWQDIMPMARRAGDMQDQFDSICRQVYCGKGTASVFDFNFAMLKAKIRAILERTEDATGPVTDIVQQVQRGMDTSRSSIESQRNEMMQISVAIGQMSAASNEIAQNTVSTADDVNETQRQCEQARGHIGQTTESIRTLAQEVEQAAGAADSLSEAAKNIDALMANIESIADQTNLLALNAAIEAARAGENGRGFAVVADEVRNLSFHTQQASKQIQGSLAAMLNTINDWVALMVQNRQQAENCVAAAEQSDQAMEVVYQGIAQIAQLAMQIAAAAEEQGAVTHDINQNVMAVSDACELNWQQTESVCDQMQLLSESVNDIANLSATFMPAKAA